MIFCGIQNISVFHVRIELGVTSSDIQKVTFPTDLIRISTHTCIPLQQCFQ